MAAPRAVASSRVMPRRMSVVWRCRCTAELATEVVITATRLVPMATRMGTPKCSAKIGVIMMPPPRPARAPINPATKPRTIKRRVIKRLAFDGLGH